MTRNLPSITCAATLALALTGCSREAEPPADTPPEVAPARVIEAEAPTSADDGDVRIEEDTSAPVANAGEAGDARADGTEESLEAVAAGEAADGPSQEVLAALSEIDALRRDLQLNEALERCIELRPEVRNTAVRRELAERMQQLREDRRLALQFPFALESLQAEDRIHRSVAERELLRGGEIGRLFLRKTVRTGSTSEAGAAARVLAEAEDDGLLASLVARARAGREDVPWEGVLETFDAVAAISAEETVAAMVALLCDRALALEPGPGRAGMASAISARSDFVPDGFLTRLYRAMADTEKEPARDHLLLLQHLFVDRCDGQVDQLAERVGVKAPLAGLGPRARFALVGGDDALHSLRGVERAAGDADGRTFATYPGAEVVSNGVLGAAVQFAGKGGDRRNMVDFGDVDALDDAVRFTIALWFRRARDRDGDSNHHTSNILVSQGSDESNDNIEIGTDGSRIEVYLDTTGSDAVSSAEAGIRDGTWHHLVLTYDGQASPAARLVVDGRPVAIEQSWSGPLDNSGSSPLTLGDTHHESTPFEGRIDEFFVYTNVLEASRIELLHVIGRNPAHAR